MMQTPLNQLDWQKMGGLLPAIIQNANTGEVLMLGYMNEEALQETVSSRQLTFYSRSKQRLWRKGETSGHIMTVLTITTDCDSDSLLVQVLPEGPACHLGYSSCFQPAVICNLQFLATLISIVSTRASEQSPQSYTAGLLKDGVSRCAQKVGEEAIEVVIAATKGDHQEYLNESADLLYHWIVLCQACRISIYDVLACLQERHLKSAESNSV